MADFIFIFICILIFIFRVRFRFILIFIYTYYLQKNLSKEERERKLNGTKNIIGSIRRGYGMYGEVEIIYFAVRLGKVEEYLEKKV